MKHVQIDIHHVPVIFKIVCSIIILSTNVLLVFYQIVNTGLVIRFLTSVMICVLLWTAKGFVLIRFDKGIISEGYTILGLRIITLYKAAFTGFEKIYINYVGPGFSTHILQRTTDSRIRTAPVYKAFLKTNEGDKFCIAENSFKKLIVQRVASINTITNCPVYDNTENA